jgi:hypothetical protein
VFSALFLARPPCGYAQEGAKSADEIARELANPNTPKATLNIKNQVRIFEGSLPDAADQWSLTTLAQPSFPFSLENGNMIFFRPGLPILYNQPYLDSDSAGFATKAGLGDLVFDLAYGATTKDGILWATGIVSSLPIATSSVLGNGRFTLGPEVLIGKLTNSYVIGAFPNHQWDVGGWGEADINITTVQFFGTFLPGGGWNVGTSPIITYDWNSEQWTVPLNLTFGKTIIRGSTPWKLSMEMNYYIEQPDSFGPKWMIGFNISPVVENPLVKIFGGRQ